MQTQSIGQVRLPELTIGSCRWSLRAEFLCGDSAIVEGFLRQEHRKRVYARLALHVREQRVRHAC